MADVEADRPLAPVGRLEERIDPAVDRVQPRRGQSPVGIAGDGVLDLDDIGDRSQSFCRYGIS
jgi:hypothetical protein